MTRYTLLFILGICSVAQAADRPVVIVVTGAEGAPEYAAEFAKWADRWIAAAKAGGADVNVIGREGQSSDEHPNSPDTDRHRLRQARQLRIQGHQVARDTEPLLEGVFSRDGHRTASLQWLFVWDLFSVPCLIY